MFFFAIIGNCLNLFVYNSGQIRFYIAIRMLCTKLVRLSCRKASFLAHEHTYDDLSLTSSLTRH